jgi:hypothetical protein
MRGEGISARIAHCRPASLSPHRGERVPTAGEGRRSQCERVEGAWPMPRTGCTRGFIRCDRPSSGLRPPSPRRAGRRSFGMHRRTVDMYPSPRMAGRGCQRRVRGDGASASEAEEVRPTPRTGCGWHHASRSTLIRPRIRYGAGSSATFSPPRGEKELRYASRTSVVAKRVPRQRSSTGTHLQPSWTKLGLRTTVPMWSPWLFTWIRQAAAAAPTTRAVSRSARKDRVNACERMLANCAQGHKLA